MLQRDESASVDVDQLSRKEPTMSQDQWIVAAKVGGSVAARTGASGDMKQLALMELILVSTHDTKQAAERAAAHQQATNEGWVFTVMRKRDYEARITA
jgi:hypothetical protein